MMTTDYSLYVLAAFLFTFIVLGAITVRSVLQLTARVREYRMLQKDTDSDDQL